MTTIACSATHRTLAGDRMSGFHSMAVTKVRELPDGSLIGGSGTSGSLMTEAMRYLAGERPDQPEIKDETIELLRLYLDGKIEVSFNLRTPIPVEGKFFAVGSGADYAMGALAAGLSPLSAIEIATRYDVNTGAGVDVLELPWGRSQSLPAVLDYSTP